MSDSDGDGTGAAPCQGFVWIYGLPYEQFHIIIDQLRDPFLIAARHTIPVFLFALAGKFWPAIGHNIGHILSETSRLYFTNNRLRILNIFKSFLVLFSTNHYFRTNNPKGSRTVQTCQRTVFITKFSTPWR